MTILKKIYVSSAISHVCLSFFKTYVLDRMTADSAASATALLCGVKTNYRILGMDGHAVYGNCAESERKSQKLDSILNWAQAAGKFDTST